jgi:hypothetical protein
VSIAHRRLTWLFSVVTVCAVACATDPTVVSPSPRSAGGTQQFVGRPVSFEYPADWFVLADPQQGEGESVTPSPSSRVLVGLDELNRVVVTGAPGSLVVTSENFHERRAAIQESVERDVLGSARIEAGPDLLTVGGEPALRWQVSSQSTVGYVLSVTVYVLFRGARQYMVRCSSIPEFVREIERGCEQVLHSAEFTYQAPLVPTAPDASPSADAEGGG